MISDSGLLFWDTLYIAWRWRHSVHSITAAMLEAYYVASV